MTATIELQRFKHTHSPTFPNELLDVPRMVWRATRYAECGVFEGSSTFETLDEAYAGALLAVEEQCLEQIEGGECVTHIDIKIVHQDGPCLGRLIANSRELLAIAALESVPVECSHCNGYGSSLKEASDRCTRCGGSGLASRSGS
jgi:hypothetical protein